MDHHQGDPEYSGPKKSKKTFPFEFRPKFLESLWHNRKHPLCTCQQSSWVKDVGELQKCCTKTLSIPPPPPPPRSLLSDVPTGGTHQDGNRFQVKTWVAFPRSRLFFFSCEEKVIMWLIGNILFSVHDLWQLKNHAFPKLMRAIAFLKEAIIPLTQIFFLIITFFFLA